MPRKSNIVLIGMPASGKSTAGVVLAKMLGLGFTDTDLLIQIREGCRLEEIIRERGIEAFLSVEEAVCKSLNVSHSVIATGGSVVYREAAMTHLREIGTVVYLDVDYEALCGRLSNIAHRGVVLKPGQTLQDLYEERKRLYERYADICIDEGKMGLEETVTAIIGACGPGLDGIASRDV